MPFFLGRSGHSKRSQWCKRMKLSTLSVRHLGFSHPYLFSLFLRSGWPALAIGHGIKEGARKGEAPLKGLPLLGKLYLYSSSMTSVLICV